MRKLYLLLAFPICLFLTDFGYAQNNFWTFPEQFLGPGGNVGTLPGAGNTTSQYTHAGILDPYGDILFFKIDDNLYNKSGTLTQSFTGNDVISYPVFGSAEALVVPQPGTCDRFYIFQTGKTQSWKEFPHYSVYNHLDGSWGGYLEFNPDGSTAINIEGNLIEEWEEPGVPNAYRNINYAATKERPDGTRWVFISNNFDVYRLDLTCDGLEPTGWKHSFQQGHTFRMGWRSEMEIYEDTLNDLVRVATPYENHNNSKWIKVAIFDIDSVSGNVIPGSEQTLELDNSSVGDATYIHGLEFSPNGKKLYVMHETNNVYSHPLSVYDIATQTLTNLAYPGLFDFKNSQLQIAGGSGNYSLIMASDDYLGSLFDPDNPDLNPNSSNWNASAVPLNDYPTNLGGNSQYSLEDIKHIVPDQIDYEDYEDIFLRTCDCCEKYAYAGANMDTAHMATATNETWSYGVGSNPWNAVPGDTIYIRDSLTVFPGANLIIQGMYFKFGPDAYAIVKRGIGQVSAARLTLTDSTVFSADFRCSQRKYTCPDPSEGCKDLKLWQGVRVEGYDNIDQTTPDGKMQAKFTMTNGSMIEYAHIGVRAGRENCTTCGGGIVTIVDSKFKDNPTGLYFDPYQRYIGGSEAYNYGKVENTHFTWTSDLRGLANITPQRHIDVRESSGLTFRGNRYENEDYAHYGKNDRGTGIYSANSRISEKWLCTGMVLPCPQNEIIQSEFMALTRGIDAYANSTTRSLEAHYGKYLGNLIGISINGLISPKVLNNEMHVPNVKDAMGISLVGSTGYAIENNNIIGMSKLNIAANYGIVVQASGEDDNELYKNTFKNLGVGILSTGQNARYPELFYGLKWKCNTFNKTIQNADIFVYKGSVNVNQGVCLAGVTGPAGNAFSHNSTTIPNHYDLRVSPGFGQSVNYRHHEITGGPTTRLVPLRYTNNGSVPGDPNIVLLQNCSGIYWSQAACPVQSWGAPATNPLGPGVMAENDGEPSMSAFDQTAGTLYAQIDAIEAQLDNGHTEELIDAIYGGAGAAAIAPLLEQAGDMVSARVLNALLASSDEAINALAYVTAGEITETNVTMDNFDDIILPSGEMESQWTSLRQAEVGLWNEIIAAYQKDTINVFPAEGVRAMLDQYRPNTAQRFASLLANETGSVQPVWLDPSNSLGDGIESVVLPVPDSEGHLPVQIDDWFINGFFDDFINTHALHTAYIENGDAYLPYVPQPNSFGNDSDDDESKSMKPDDDDEIAEVEIALQPNPFDENLTIKAKFAENLGEYATLRFYDALGREVMTRDIPAETGDWHIDGRSLPEGLLIYTVEIEGRIIKSGKVVKRR